MVQQPITTDALVEPAPANEERRARRRLSNARRILARPADPKCREEVQTTLNATRDGLYFTTPAAHYYLGMRLRVTVGYSPTDPCNSMSFGEVVRIDSLADGGFGIAVRIVLR